MSIYIISSTAFQFVCMIYAINIMDGCGLSSIVHYGCLPKKTRVMLHLAVDL